ncbi:MAG: hypothetical protein DRI56_11450 [Chloroflexota bacterium]|nr:MAG: hypothetical protein DRI56_11450 [Chloroflexota bacterium]
MSKKSILLVLVVTLMLLVTGCGGEGGTSGSMRGDTASSTITTKGGQATGSFTKLTGTYYLSFDAYLADAVQVDVQLSIESGPVRVFLVAPNGSETSITVNPGETGNLSGVAETSYSSFDDAYIFRVYLEALEGETLGGQYTVNFTYLLE